jgi:hypothetical protein
VQFVGALIIASLLAGVALPARAAEATRNVLLLYSATRLLRQKPGSFSLDQVLQKLRESGGSGKH